MYKGIKRLLFTITLLVFIFGMVGCGVKGPLYAPTDAPSHVTKSE